jgi:hypothetical protein
MERGNRVRTMGTFWNMCGLSGSFMGTVILFQGCAARQVFVHRPVEIRGSLPPEKLAHFNETFDGFREDLWDKSDLLLRTGNL